MNTCEMRPGSSFKWRRRTTIWGASFYFFVGRRRDHGLNKRLLSGVGTEHWDALHGMSNTLQKRCIALSAICDRKTRRSVTTRRNPTLLLRPQILVHPSATDHFLGAAWSIVLRQLRRLSSRCFTKRFRRGLQMSAWWSFSMAPGLNRRGCGMCSRDTRLGKS
jgi:hypothetical protein